MAATGTHGFCHSPPSFLRPVMLRNLFKAWLKGRSESLVAFDQYVERMFAGGDRFVCTLGYSWCIYVCNPCISMRMTTHIAYILRWLHRSISSYCKCISWKTSWQNFICSIKDELHCPSLPMSRESGSTGGILLTARCMKPQILWTSIVTWSLAGLGQDSEALGNKLRFTSGVLLRHLMRFRGFIVRVHVVPCHYPPGDDGLPADRCGWWALSSYIYGFPSRPLDVPLVLTKWLLFWEINLSCSYSKMCRGCFHGVGLRHADKKLDPKLVPERAQHSGGKMWREVNRPYFFFPLPRIAQIWRNSATASISGVTCRHSVIHEELCISLVSMLCYSTIYC